MTPDNDILISSFIFVSAYDSEISCQTVVEARFWTHILNGDEIDIRVQLDHQNSFDNIHMYHLKLNIQNINL